MNRAAQGCPNKLCTKHSPTALKQARQVSEVAQRNKTLGESSPTFLLAKLLKKRVSAPKRCANPLSNHYASLFQIKPEHLLFKDVDLPVMIDVGCARGIMLDKLCGKHPDWNFLGIEIRPEIAKEANLRLQNSGKKDNLQIIPGNFAVAVQDVVALVGVENLKVVAFQFPDPWRRNKHRKRRIIQPDLVQKMASLLRVGTLVYLSSDMEEIAVDMKLQFQQNDAFKMVATQEIIFQSDIVDFQAQISCDLEDWLNINPLGELSEREQVCEEKWRNVWRCLFVRSEIQLEDGTEETCLEIRH